MLVYSKHLSKNSLQQIERERVNQPRKNPSVKPQCSSSFKWYCTYSSVTRGD